MPTPETIELYRRALGRGREVLLELSDGAELRGTVAYVDADSVRLEGMAEPVRFAVIEDLLLEIGTDGIE